MITIIRADAAALPLPDASVDLICTSPPYFGLRDYRDAGESMAGQIGSEPTPAAYIAALTGCTREWVRVLKPEGSIFVNLGDKYSSGGRASYDRKPDLHSNVERGAIIRPQDDARPKSLLGVPWRYALACADQLGLILRAEIIWAKPNGLPEFVTDRVRRAHEQVFHFTRQPRYYSAVDKIREPHTGPEFKGRAGISAPGYVLPEKDGLARVPVVMRDREYNPLGKLPGSVWSIPSQPLTVPAHLGADHFAAFPMELPRRIIAGWSPPGVCTECGQGRRPVSIVDAASLNGWALAQRGGRSWHGDGTDPKRALGVAAADRNRRVTGCACSSPDAPTRPAVVLDPLGGTGTTALLAHVSGRHGISVDRSADYCRIAAWRCTDPGERARAMQVPRPPAVPAEQEALFAMPP